ncbi:unnamed protein product [Jaminaea pallidilutea]
MGKSDEEVVQEFNEIVNMSASDLEKWLKSESSESAGWGGESGETVGHNSGRNIVDILSRNPKKDPSKYTDEDKEHMRKVVAYCKRHLAQEASLKDRKSEEELVQSKSYRSLKNWGHDMLA